MMDESDEIPKSPSVSSKRPRTQKRSVAVSGQGTNPIGRENQPSGIVRCDIKRALKVWPRIDGTNGGDQWWPRATKYHKNGDVTGREHQMHQTWWMIVSRLMDLNGFDHQFCWRLPWTSGFKPSKLIPQDSTIRFRNSTNSTNKIAKYHQTSSNSPCQTWPMEIEVFGDPTVGTVFFLQLLKLVNCYPASLPVLFNKLG